MMNVNDILIVMIQHCAQGLLTTTEAKSMGQEKKKEQYIHTGNSVGVVTDTAKGDLSFVLDDVNLGVAFDGIPLDKLLVPCVIQ